MDTETVALLGEAESEIMRLTAELESSRAANVQLTGANFERFAYAQELERRLGIPHTKPVLSDEEKTLVGQAAMEIVRLEFEVAALSSAAKQNAPLIGGHEKYGAELRAILRDREETIGKIAQRLDLDGPLSWPRERDDEVIAAVERMLDNDSAKVRLELVDKLRQVADHLGIGGIETFSEADADEVVAVAKSVSDALDGHHESDDVDVSAAIERLTNAEPEGVNPTDVDDAISKTVREMVGPIRQAWEDLHPTERLCIAGDVACAIDMAR